MDMKVKIKIKRVNVKKEKNNNTTLRKCISNLQGLQCMDLRTQK